MPIDFEESLKRLIPIDFENESAIPWDEVPEILPRRHGKKVHISTVFRWMTVGLAGVVLPSVLIANKRFTTRQAVFRFLNTTSHLQREKLSTATKLGMQRAREQRREVRR